MKILVTGVKGQLGFDVVNELEKRGHTAIGVDIEEMDITNKESVNTVIPVSYTHLDVYKRQPYRRADYFQ